MKQQHDSVEALSLLEERISITELIRISGLSRAEIEDLVDFGIFEPQGQSPAAWVFSAHSIMSARTAGRLRRDFDLNAPGIALA